MPKNIIISQEAIQFLRHEQRKGDASIVIHRDDPSISCCNVQPSTFIINLEVRYGEEPNESFFTIYDKSHGIPVWIEKRLLSYLENMPVLISLKKGLFKRLKIDIGSEILQSQ
jgi:hypothetical protein